MESAGDSRYELRALLSSFSDHRFHPRGAGAEAYLLEYAEFDSGMHACFSE